MEAKLEKPQANLPNLLVQIAQESLLLTHDPWNLFTVQLNRSSCYFCFCVQVSSSFPFTPSFLLHRLISHFSLTLMQ
jgi:hypothetical protein